MRSRFKAWANPLLNLHPEVIKTAVDTSDSFYQDGVSLEIGGGKGAFSLDKASHGEKMLVLEKDSSVSGLFLKKYLSYEEPLPIHWVREDFDKFYPELRKLRFNRIYLNFSDPWPKKRHEKRRLTFPARLKMFNSLLTSDGKVYFKTDNYFIISDCKTVYFHKNFFYCDVDDISDIMSVIEFGSFVYGNNLYIVSKQWKTL